MKGSITIGCDNCREFLGFDGRAHFADSLEVRSFPNIREADDAALQAGWKFEIGHDAEPRVICPRCQK